MKNSQSYGESELRAGRLGPVMGKLLGPFMGGWSGGSEVDAPPGILPLYDIVFLEPPSGAEVDAPPGILPLYDIVF
jgi:hypothetical protein